MAKYFLYNNILIVSVLILIVGTLLAYIVFLFFKQKINTNFTNNNINLILLTTLFLSFFFFNLSLYFFFKKIIFNQNYLIFNLFKLTPKNYINTFLFFFEFSIDFFGIIILFLSFFVGIFSLISLDNRIFWKNNKYFFYINIFIIVIFFFVFSSNVLLFFLCYELLLLPSFLIVYFISPSRRSVQASLYFLIWTQIGSFLVFLSIVYMISLTGSFEFFNIRNFLFTKNEIFCLYFLLFIGFGFKIPIWPFHYWLIKTHVEAPAGFSMFLSGFLVKTAVYGFYKITILLGNNVNTTFFLTICVIGIIDSSLKMWGQTDLKKLVAYCTIQEMNLIYLTLNWGDTSITINGILFVLMHGSLSTLMFFLVDCVQRRFNSRSVVEISGILQITPVLGISILIMCVIFSGLPGSLKFNCEFYLFCSLFSMSPILTFLLFLITNVIGLIGFSKCWFNVTFGIFLKNFKTAPFDLNIKEIYIISANILFLFLSSFMCNYFF